MDRYQHKSGIMVKVSGTTMNYKEDVLKQRKRSCFAHNASLNCVIQHHVRFLMPTLWVTAGNNETMHW